MTGSLANVFKLAWKEIRGSRGFSLFFVLNLSLGLCGFLALDAFRHSVDSYFAERARGILGADLEVEVDDRKMTADDREDIHAVLPEGTVERFEKHFYTMAATKGRSRLVDVQAVDAKFPFYGSLKLKEKGLVEPGKPTELIDEPVIWLYPELAVQLDVAVGDEIKIGGKPFRVGDIVAHDPALSRSGFAAAPKVYLGIPQIEDTGLFGRGSRFEDSRYYKFPAEAPPPEKIAEKLKATARAPDLEVEAPKGSAGRLGRFWETLGDYLTLISLVALYLAGVGAAYLFRGFLEKRLREIAVLKSLGAGIGVIRGIYATQLVVLALFATAGAVGVALAILPLLPLLLGALLPAGMELTLPGASVTLTTVVAVLTSLIVAYPLLRRLGDVSPAALFQESGGFGRLAFRARDGLAFVPALAFYWGLAVWQSGSFKTGSVFLGVFTGGLVALILVGAGVWTLAARFGRARSVPLRLAALSLTRHRMATATGFLAIGSGALLAGVVPQIRAVLHQELAPQAGSEYPSLFMFDIQPHQIEPLKKRLAENGVTLQYIHPLVRARLKKLQGESLAVEKQEPAEKPESIDDQAGEKDREKSHWLTRGYNLTYREKLKSSESLVAGRPFEKAAQGAGSAENPAEISLEEDFASDLDLELGDTMTFDVTGQMVTGKVVSLRHIKWSSFQPNFFVMFQPGVLNDAPKQFVATVPPLSTEAKNALQNDIVTRFPNVAMVDVSRTVSRILSVVETVTTAMAFMALVTLAAGIAVVLSIARFKAETKRPETALLKVLGARFRDVRRTAALEFALLGTAAALGGSVLSTAAAYVFSYVLFDQVWHWTWQWPVAILVIVPIVCIVAGLAATRSALRTSPLSLLGE